jgi:hypothetical protein
MKRVVGVMLALLMGGCVSNSGVSFEKLSYEQTLGKAKELSMPILVDVFSDG